MDSVKRWSKSWPLLAPDDCLKSPRYTVSFSLWNRSAQGHTEDNKRNSCFLHVKTSSKPGAGGKVRETLCLTADHTWKPGVVRRPVLSPRLASKVRTNLCDLPHSLIARSKLQNSFVCISKKPQFSVTEIFDQEFVLLKIYWWFNVPKHVNTGSLIPFNYWTSRESFYSFRADQTRHSSWPCSTATLTAFTVKSCSLKKQIAGSASRCT